MANVNGNGSEGNYMQPSIPRLDGHYEYWSMLMENFLRSNKYCHLIETGIVEPTQGATTMEAQQKKLDESKLKDLKAENYLFQAINRATLETIFSKGRSKEIWDFLKIKFQGNDWIKRSTLQTLEKNSKLLR